MRKGSSELVSMLWLRMTAYDAQSGVRQLERLNAAIAQSRLEIPIAAVFSLDDVARAHERVESGHLIGKVVLNISLGRSA
jgi:NADPH:quinone reductase-like Zn-dependent oxidoreductase